jgi:hypothetical protein
MLSFGVAVEALKRGKAVARKRWDELWPGSGMRIYVQFGSTITKEQARNGVLTRIDGDITIRPHIDMVDADGEVICGEQFSQSDILADDWYIVETA